jgi:hypothetical protein
LNRQNRLLIVPAMTKTALALTLLILVAVPAFAQTSELGFSFGGVSRRPDGADKKEVPPLTSGWTFGSSVKEVYYSILLEPTTRFKIKAGEMDSKLTFVTIIPATSPDAKPTVIRHNTTGQVEHVDGLIDYRFDEPFGSTGLFAGAGLYRQKGGGMNETNYGLSAGVNGDFPLNKRSGVVVEGAYHWTNFDDRSRYITVTAGLRFRF